MHTLEVVTIGLLAWGMSLIAAFILGGSYAPIVIKECDMLSPPVWEGK
jgi:hypothetical protein